jgi:hypothetical protein
MSLDFPNTPSNGAQYEGYVWNNAIGVWQIDNNFNYSDPIRLFQANPQIGADYSVPENFNFMTIGPLSVAFDMTLTIPSGSKAIIF